MLKYNWTDPDWLAQWQTLHPRKPHLSLYSGFESLRIDPWEMFDMAPIPLADRFASFKRRLAEAFSRA